MMECFIKAFKLKFRFGFIHFFQYYCYYQSVQLYRNVFLLKLTTIALSLDEKYNTVMIGNVISFSAQKPITIPMVIRWVNVRAGQITDFQ